MAQRVQVLLVDDIDNTDADETVTFALDGVSYEIDLNNANAAKLRDALAPWVGHARRSGGRKSTGRSSGANHRTMTSISAPVTTMSARRRARTPFVPGRCSIPSRWWCSTPCRTNASSTIRW